MIADTRPAIHGSEDHCQSPSRAPRFGELTGAELVILEGAGHLIPGRQPVKTDLLTADLVRRLSGSPT